MITRLSGADVLSLHAQTSTRPAHTVALIVLKASDQLSHERLRGLLASSLPQLARFRSRLVGKPLGLGQPVWAAIDDYDPTPQIHSATVDAPGGTREFVALIAQLSTGRENRRQPPWEAWSIDGLEGRHWALAIKMSPLLSGQGTGSIWSHLLTTRPHDNPTNEMASQVSFGTPSLGELVTDAVSEIVENQVTGVWLIAEAMAGGLEAMRQRLRGANDPEPLTPAASSMSGPVPQTVFDAPLTRRRAVAFASIPLTDLKMVSHAFGGSITNVFLAACTLSLRAWLQRHDTVPEHPLSLQMPLALPVADPANPGNPLAVGEIRLPVQLDDPVLVLTNLHTATERLTAEHGRAAENDDSTIDFAAIAALIPPPIARAGMQLYTRSGLRQRLTPIRQGCVSYIAGTSGPAYCAGVEVVGMHTVAPLLEERGLSITVTARSDDIIDLTVCVCPDNVAAVDNIATGIAEAVDVLVAAADESPRGQGRSVVTEITSHVEKRSHGRHH